MGLISLDLVDKENFVFEPKCVPVAQVDGVVRDKDKVIGGNNDDVQFIVREELISGITSNVFTVFPVVMKRKSITGKWVGLRFPKGDVSIICSYENGRNIRYVINSTFPIFTGKDQATFTVFCNEYGLNEMNRITNEWKTERVPMG